MLAAGLAAGALVAFGERFGVGVSLTMADVLAWGPLVLVAAALVGVGAGLYPAVLAARFDPISILKGTDAGPLSGDALRKTLVVLQFTIAIVLILGLISAGVVFLIYLIENRVVHWRDSSFMGDT